jgi:hypothetical protein
VAANDFHPIEIRIVPEIMVRKAPNCKGCNTNSPFSSPNAFLIKIKEEPQIKLRMTRYMYFNLALSIGLKNAKVTF